MPEYTFVCDNCEQVFSVTRRMKDSGDPYGCPLCNGPARRVFHAPAVTYHFDGFFHTDYAKDGSVGSKNDQLAKDWERQFGEKLPPPATDISRNSGDKI